MNGAHYLMDALVESVALRHCLRPERVRAWAKRHCISLLKVLMFYPPGDAELVGAVIWGRPLPRKEFRA